MKIMADLEDHDSIPAFATFGRSPLRLCDKNMKDQSPPLKPEKNEIFSIRLPTMADGQSFSRKDSRMRMIIIGAGSLGINMAELLVRTGHDVFVIDKDKDKLDRLENYLELRAVHGNGCNPKTLHLAQVGQADLVLALTRAEETNLIAATVARGMGAHRVVARARSNHYMTGEDFDFRKQLGIDLIVSPEALAAGEVVKFLDNPDALALSFYAQNRVQLLQFELTADHAYCNRRIRELELPGAVLVVLISRGGEVIIPRGDVLLAPGDRVTLLGKSGTIGGMRHITQRERGRLGSVIIAGGGETGQLIASTLERKVRSVKLLEIDSDRARRLGGWLDQTNVLLGDATDRNFLVDERIGEADVFIAAMETDEDNIMATLLAKKLGAARGVALVKRADYSPILEENTAIDLALNPNEITATRILTMIRSGRIRNVSFLEEGRVEVIEFSALADSAAINIPLRELTLPPDCLAGVIIRGNTIRIPRGEDEFKPGDTVIMVMLTAVADRVERLFLPRG